MPRYYKYKRAYKRIYPKKKWASNIKSDYLNMTLSTSSNTAESTAVLCTNSVQTANPTPVIIKFGRLKMKGDIRYSATNVSQFTSATLYAVFVPQGNNLSLNLISDHPEYILGWTCISMDSGSNFSLTTALKRNLNSGDSVQILCKINTTTTPSQNITYNFFYTAQYWITSS